MKGNTQKLIEKLRGVPASVVFDALTIPAYNLGYRPDKIFMSNIRSLFDLDEPIIGPALTIKNELSRDRPAQKDWNIGFKAIDEANPGDFVVIEGNGDPKISLLGDIMALRCKKRGVKGVVLDGGCRDVATIKELKLPIFAMGTAVMGSSHYLKTISSNVPVRCGGLQVSPKDIIVGDSDGVVVIPYDVDMFKVAEIVEKLLKEEERARKLLEEGRPLVEAYLL